MLAARHGSDLQMLERLGPVQTGFVKKKRHIHTLLSATQQRGLVPKAGKGLSHLARNSRSMMLGQVRLHAAL